MSKGLSGFNVSELVQCIALFGLANLSRLLSSEWEWDQNVDFLTEKGVIVPLKDIAWNCLPRNYFDTHAGEVASHLRSLDNSDSGSLVKSMLDRFPSHLAMFCLLEGLIDDPADISQLASSLDSYVKQIYSGDVQLPGYLKEYIATEMKSRGGIMADPSIGHIFSFYQFKKYLHEEDLKFVSLYEKSEYLQSRIDIFILKEIFSLLLANNSLDSVYSLFMGRLWELFATKKINLSNEIDKILTLFPSCYSLPNDLSCEAIYWEKQEIFLCRGKLCSSPKVTGGKGSNYLEFSIYDWFFHYGIHYAAEKKPDRRDFPIKLAGYLNRLREIFDVLHCRQCKSLMLPDLRYGRVEYTEFTNGEFVKKDMAPAYRLTVFKCRNDHCKDHQVGYYINHCLGFGCYELIDSRDCKRKCDNGLLICKGCGSCCEIHAKSNPAGMCPDCGARL
ncbi:MAG: hypothetical protein Q8L06_20170, partial [Pseudohongiella sp.]|nr:hypothetical protein [Pseudohongiella sp.]